MKKFPWKCGDCPMLKTYDMSIDDLTHICLWSKNQIDDCDRYQSAECPLEKHDSKLLDKVANRIKDNMCSCDDKEAGNCNANECGFEIEIGTIHKAIDEVVEEMKKDTHIAV